MLHADGSVFKDEDLSTHDALLRELEADERVEYRNFNAATIAGSVDRRTLIVAGPGTGKSHLFLARITDWLQSHPGERIYVCSFVRKLVFDLNGEIQSSDLSPAEKKLVTVTTLHGLARSILERNGGTSEHRLKPYIQMISQNGRQ
jgi:superfamily I DNA/RNA helicase